MIFDPKHARTPDPPRESWAKTHRFGPKMICSRLFFPFDHPTGSADPTGPHLTIPQPTLGPSINFRPTISLSTSHLGVAGRFLAQNILKHWAQSESRGLTLNDLARKWTVQSFHSFDHPNSPLGRRR